MTQQRATVKADLEAEVCRLRHVLTSQAVVDQAIGVIIAFGALCPEQGRSVLEQVSRRTGTEPRVIAEHVLRWAQDKDVPGDIDRALRTAILQARAGGCA